MDRRRFLGLLPAAAAAAIATPAPVRSYFFGPWAPASGWEAVQPADLTLDGVDYQFVHDLVDKRILPASYFIPSPNFIPSIWTDELLRAVQSRLPVGDYFEWQNDLYVHTARAVYQARHATPNTLTIREITPLRTYGLRKLGPHEGAGFAIATMTGPGIDRP